MTKYKILCEDCNGYGNVSGHRCMECDGFGTVDANTEDDIGFWTGTMYAAIFFVGIIAIGNAIELILRYFGT